MPRCDDVEMVHDFGEGHHRGAPPDSPRDAGTNNGLVKGQEQDHVVLMVAEMMDGRDFRWSNRIVVCGGGSELLTEEETNRIVVRGGGSELLTEEE